LIKITVNDDLLFPLQNSGEDILTSSICEHIQNRDIKIAGRK
jgi:hypothetical protein